MIDLAPARSGSAARQQEVASKIDRACRDIGFFVVTETGVPERLIAAAYETFSRFIALPTSEKNACRLPEGPAHPNDPYTPYGYSGILEENAFAYMGDIGRSADYVEKFSLGRLALDSAHPVTVSECRRGGDARRVGRLLPRDSGIGRRAGGAFRGRPRTSARLFRRSYITIRRLDALPLLSGDDLRVFERPGDGGAPRWQSRHSSHAYEPRD